MKSRNSRSTVLTRPNMPSRLPSAGGGFTLLEVIVALGIVAVGILGVARAMNGYVDTTSALEQRVVASWVAANRLEYLRISKAIPVAGETRGTDRMGGRTWYFRETTTATADPLLFRIDISVYADKEQTDEVGRMTGYLLNNEVVDEPGNQSISGTNTSRSIQGDTVRVSSFQARRSEDPESILLSLFSPNPARPGK